MASSRRTALRRPNAPAKVRSIVPPADTEEPMPEEKWVDVGSVDALRSKPVTAVRVGTTPIALVFRAGEFTAISGVCNHVGGPLGEGRLDGDYVVCPWHNWKFHCRRGEGEPGFEEDRVPAYATRVEDGRVLVDATARTRATRSPTRRIRSRARCSGARAGARGRDLDHGDGRANPRCSSSEELLAHGIAHARTRSARDAPHPAQRPALPRLRGLLLEERPRLHLAVLDHADGPGRPARARLRGVRPLGRRDPRSRRRSAGARRARSTTRWSSA